MTKKVITRAVLDIKTNRWVEEESHEYDGPWAYAGAATIAQTGYAFYEDGTESGATQIGTDTTQATIDSDTNTTTKAAIAASTIRLCRSVFIPTSSPPHAPNVHRETSRHRTTHNPRRSHKRGNPTHTRPYRHL